MTDKPTYEELKKRLIDITFIKNKLEMEKSLLGGVEHDLGNLLLSLIGHSELALEFTEKSHPSYEHIRSIYDSTDCLRGLIQNLRGFGKRSYCGNYSIDDILKEDIENLKKTIHPHEKILISYECSDDKLEVYCDRTQILSLYINLMVNAVESMSHGGNLNIRIKRFEGKPSESLTEGSYVLTEIEDTGKGIPQSIIDRIFDPFFSTKEKGTGLGLRVSKTIAEVHKGDILVKSEVGKGSVFSVYLPLYQEPQN